MKRMIGGIAFLLFGLVLYVSMHNQAVEQLPAIGSWPAKGKMWQALVETHGLTPTYIAIAFCIAGTLLILWDIAEDYVGPLQELRNKYKDK
ncbi:hypothetical protein [Paenibacillus tengchongensis]|uniref:hypothetical protein n=1 Tax=Paenibacillus tengchongensis TaxID=2608684 RepID=UPI00124E7D26|nr:hypothetical protein [Paenibacillus tengchongensis]